MVESKIDLEEFLLIAEAVLDVPAEDVARMCRIPEAESALAAPYASFGGVSFYTDPITRAAVVCSRIQRNHPLPDGNKRVGFVCMIETLNRAGIEWVAGDEAKQDDDATTIELLAAGAIDEEEFIAWLGQRVASRAAIYRVMERAVAYFLDLK